MSKSKNMNWDSKIEKLNGSKAGRLSVEMGSPGSAQVTRHRIMATYDGLFAKTNGSKITFSLEPFQ